MEELRPCPFCGGEASIYHGDDTGENIKGTRYVMAFCGWCGASIRRKNEEEVIKKWNNRPSPWHTGTPTEEGLYAVYFLDDHNPSATPYEVLYDGFLSPDGEGNWIDRDGEIRFIDDDIVRWHKIEKED